MDNPSFYAIIPANVRYSDITPNAKLLYGEITALCNKYGYCYATNEYFAKLYNVSKVSISKWIKELIDNNFVNSEIIYKDGTKEILNRYIRIVYDPIKENFNTLIKENFKDNNTYINNTLNIIEKEKYKKENIPCTEKTAYGVDFGELKEPMEKWLAYKKEKGQTYKSIGLKTCFDKLKRFSGGSVEVANEIIESAIANNYSGFFELKKQSSRGCSGFGNDEGIPY